MALIPYTRVAYLLGIPQCDLPPYMKPHWLKSVPTTTPKTLTGCPSGLSSYQLTIAFKDGDDWFVYADKNSPTTNRHIRAAVDVLVSQGYAPTDETKTLAHGMNRHSVYRRYRKQR